ncbi:MAG: hypothetical protein AAF360_19135 [Pseudomonadota bacterium]
MIAEDQLAGWWRRLWIRAPGLDDATTRVHWAQGPGLYVDLRVPEFGEDVGAATCLAELSAERFEALKDAEAFAGEISVAGDVCTWRRDINWRGRPSLIDAGRMSFGEDGDLYEDGVHIEYRERWTCVSDTALTARRYACGEMIAYLVSSETTFIFGVGPAVPPPAVLPPAVLPPAVLPPAVPPPSEPDPAAPDERPSADVIAALFASEYAVGRWEGGDGVAELCTNPFRVGKPVLSRRASGGFDWFSEDIYGALRSMSLV